MCVFFVCVYVYSCVVFLSVFVFFLVWVSVVDIVLYK